MALSYVALSAREGTFKIFRSPGVMKANVYANQAWLANVYANQAWLDIANPLAVSKLLSDLRSAAQR